MRYLLLLLLLTGCSAHQVDYVFGSLDPVENERIFHESVEGSPALVQADAYGASIQGRIGSCDDYTQAVLYYLRTYHPEVEAKDIIRKYKGEHHSYVVSGDMALDTNFGIITAAEMEVITEPLR